MSNCLTKLFELLHLAVEYCKNYHVELVPEKTILLAFHPSGKNLGLYIQEVSLVFYKAKMSVIHHHLKE